MTFRARSIDARLARLAELKAASPESAREEARKALGDKIGLIVAKAAALAETLRLRELIPELVAAFNAHMIDPAETDKGCQAKIAIMRALHAMDYAETGVYERGIAHFQREGLDDDTAIPLRAMSAIVLAALRHPRILELLLPLMLDEAAPVRAAAMRAIAATGRPEAPLLLRFKALIGDHDEEVMTECFCGLLDRGGQEALDFVAGFLDSGKASDRAAAALAVGTSKLPGAFDLLRRQWPSGDADFRQALLLALTSMRDPRAMDFLLQLIRDANPQHSTEALQALKSARLDERTRQRIKEATEERTKAEG